MGPEGVATDICGAVDRAYSPPGGCGAVPWAVSPCWYKAAPLALREAGEEAVTQGLGLGELLGYLHAAPSGAPERAAWEARREIGLNMAV